MGEDRFSPSTDPSSYDGVFFNFSPILDWFLYYFFVLRWSFKSWSQTVTPLLLMRVKFSCFYRYSQKEHTAHAQWGREHGTLEWRHALILLLGFNEASSSRERDFTIVAASAIGYLPLSSLVLGLSAAKYHRAPFPAGIPTEPGQAVSALPTPHFILLRRCVWMENHPGIGLKSCQLHFIQGAANVIYSLISVLL